MRKNERPITFRGYFLAPAEVNGMKKLWITLLLLLFLAGCGKQVRDEYSVNIVSDAKSVPNKTEETVDGIVMIETEDSMVWDEDMFFFSLDEDVLEEITPIKTKEDAKEVAIAILEKCHTKGKMTDSALCSIAHFSKDNLWRFEYASKEVAFEMADGSAWYVAVDGDKGNFVKAWTEE